MLTLAQHTNKRMTSQPAQRETWYSLRTQQYSFFSVAFPNIADLPPDFSKWWEKQKWWRYLLINIYQHSFIFELAIADETRYKCCL